MCNVYLFRNVSLRDKLNHIIVRLKKHLLNSNRSQLQLWNYQISYTISNNEKWDPSAALYIYIYIGAKRAKKCWSGKNIPTEHTTNGETIEFSTFSVFLISPLFQNTSVIGPRCSVGVYYVTPRATRESPFRWYLYFFANLYQIISEYVVKKLNIVDLSGCQYQDQSFNRFV